MNVATIVQQINGPVVSANHIQNFVQRGLLSQAFIFAVVQRFLIFCQALMNQRMRILWCERSDGVQNLAGYESCLRTYHRFLK